MGLELKGKARVRVRVSSSSATTLPVSGAHRMPQVYSAIYLVYSVYLASEWSPQDAPRPVPSRREQPPHAWHAADERGG